MVAHCAMNVPGGSSAEVRLAPAAGQAGVQPVRQHPQPHGPASFCRLHGNRHAPLLHGSPAGESERPTQLTALQQQQLFSQGNALGCKE